jgi:RND family efflux transporter MFP subunit
MKPVVAGKPPAAAPKTTVAVVKAARRAMGQQLTLSSELVPFQQIDIYAKESGYVKQLFVDYGTHVTAGQPIAILEIPELQMELQEDDAAIRAAASRVQQADNQLQQIAAERNVRHLEYERLDNVAKSRPGLVAQQEVDQAQGKDLEAAAAVEANRATISSAENELAAARAKRGRDQALFDYSKITAPFSGVITQRYANLGTLVQAGTGSSTQVIPIVQLSQDNLFRLVIPVPESYVRYIRVGDAVKVFIPSLSRTFPGKVARFSVDVSQQTRTMHTEVDVPNPTGTLMPGLYAEASLMVTKASGVLALPVQAVHKEGDESTICVVDSSGRIEQRQVKLGAESANWDEIDAGLRPGELVVTSDPGGLRPGQPVIARVSAPVQYNAGEEEMRGP